MVLLSKPHYPGLRLCELQSPATEVPVELRLLKILTGLQVSLPQLDLALPAYYVLAVSEASSNLARYDGVRYGLRQPVSVLAVYLFDSNNALICILQPCLRTRSRLEIPHQT